MMSKSLALFAVIGLVGLIQSVACAGSKLTPLEHYFSEEEIKYMKPYVIEALQEMIEERKADKEVGEQEEKAQRAGNEEKQQPCASISYRNQAQKPTDLKGKTKANVEYQCRFCCRDHDFTFSYTTWDSKRHCQCTDSLLRKMFGVIEFDTSG